MELDEVDSEGTLLNNARIVWRWFAAGVIVPCVIGALQNALEMSFVLNPVWGAIDWLSVPASIGLSAIIPVYIVRANYMFISRMFWDFLRLFLPSILSFLIFLVLGGFLTFNVVRIQRGESSLENYLLQFAYAVIATVLGIFLVHMARGETFLSAVKAPFRRIRKEPAWTISSAIAVLLVMWVGGFVIGLFSLKLSKIFGFTPVYMYVSLWVVVLEYVDTRRIRSWRDKFK